MKKENFNKVRFITIFVNKNLEETWNLSNSKIFQTQNQDIRKQCLKLYLRTEKKSESFFFTVQICRYRAGSER